MSKTAIRNRTAWLVLFTWAFMLNGQISKAQSFAVGADLSFMKMAEDGGFSFKENGQALPCLEIFKNHGYNWIRLRLFHTPTRLPNDLKYTISLAKEAKNMGFKFLLDYHNSDT